MNYLKGNDRKSERQSINRDEVTVLCILLYIILCMENKIHLIARIVTARIYRDLLVCFRIIFKRTKN